MLISGLLLQENDMEFNREEYEESPDHAELTERLRKTLYFGKSPTSDRPSLPVTEIAVEFFREASPKELGKVDCYFAASASRKASMSPCSLMLGMLYIERLKNKNPEYLQQISSQDLFLISMMMASKYLYDEGVDEEVFNDEWADAANMDVKDLNELERSFLDAIDWNLFVRREEFFKVLGGVEQCIAVKMGADRNFYTYTDLLILLASAKLQHSFRQVLLDICKVMMVCSVAYVAGSTIVLSSVLTLNYVKHNIPANIQPNLMPFVPLLSDSKDDDSSDVQRSTSCNTRSEYCTDGSDDTLTQRQTNSKEIEDSDSMDLPSQLPGFLTLVMIKDALLQFAVGVRDNIRRDHHRHMNQEFEFDFYPSQLTCMCGCCPPNVKGHCQNVTSFEQSTPPLQVHSKNKHGLGLWKLNRLEGQGKENHADTFGTCDRPGKCRLFQCCCTAGDMLQGGSDWSIPDDYRFHDVTTAFSTTTNKPILVPG